MYIHAASFENSCIFMLLIDHERQGVLRRKSWAENLLGRQGEMGRAGPGLVERHLPS